MFIESADGKVEPFVLISETNCSDLAFIVVGGRFVNRVATTVQQWPSYSGQYALGVQGRKPLVESFYERRLRLDRLWSYRHVAPIWLTVLTFEIGATGHVATATPKCDIDPIVAHKLAVILHRMWIDGTEFNCSTKKVAA